MQQYIFILLLSHAWDAFSYSNLDVISVSLSDKMPSRGPVLFGLGNELVWQSVNDSKLMTKVKETGSIISRYPGGTPSDYWDWSTGWASDCSTLDKRPATPLAWSTYLNQSKQQHNILVVNQLTSNLSYQIQGLRAHSDAGTKVEYIEMGNEMYDSSRSDVVKAYPKPSDYATKVANWSAGIKKEFINASVAFVAMTWRPGMNPSSREALWNDGVFHPKYLEHCDAATLHPYFGIHWKKIQSERKMNKKKHPTEFSRCIDSSIRQIQSGIFPQTQMQTYNEASFDAKFTNTSCGSIGMGAVGDWIATITTCSNDCCCQMECIHRSDCYGWQFMTDKNTKVYHHCYLKNNISLAPNIASNAGSNPHPSCGNVGMGAVGECIATITTCSNDCCCQKECFDRLDCYGWQFMTDENTTDYKHCYLKNNIVLAPNIASNAGSNPHYSSVLASPFTFFINNEKMINKIPVKLRFWVTEVAAYGAPDLNFTWLETLANIVFELLFIRNPRVDVMMPYCIVCGDPIAPNLQSPSAEASPDTHSIVPPYDAGKVVWNDTIRSVAHGLIFNAMGTMQTDARMHPLKFSPNPVLSPLQPESTQYVGWFIGNLNENGSYTRTDVVVLLHLGNVSTTFDLSKITKISSKKNCFKYVHIYPKNAEDVISQTLEPSGLGKESGILPIKFNFDHAQRNFEQSNISVTLQPYGIYVLTRSKVC